MTLGGGGAEKVREGHHRVITIAKFGRIIGWDTVVNPHIGYRRLIPRHCIQVKIHMLDRDLHFWCDRGVAGPEKNVELEPLMLHRDMLYGGSPYLKRIQGIWDQACVVSAQVCCFAANIPRSLSASG